MPKRAGCKDIRQITVPGLNRTTPSSSSRTLPPPCPCTSPANLAAVQPANLPGSSQPATKPYEFPTSQAHPSILAPLAAGLNSPGFALPRTCRAGRRSRPGAADRACKLISLPRSRSKRLVHCSVPLEGNRPRQPELWSRQTPHERVVARRSTPHADKSPMLPPRRQSARCVRPVAVPAHPSGRRS